MINVVASFRLGSHWLNIDTGRFSKPKVARSQRLCTCCKMKIREDELLIFNCPFKFEFRCNLPFFDKFKWDNVDSSMNSMMNGHGHMVRYFWQSLASFLLNCKEKRTIYLPTSRECFVLSFAIVTIHLDRWRALLPPARVFFVLLFCVSGWMGGCFPSPALNCVICQVSVVIRVPT